MNTKDAAKLYVHELGWSVIPIGQDDEGQFKRPLVKWTDFQQRVASDQEIDVWWERWPDARLGVVTGSISDLCVVDVDIPGLELTTTPTLVSKTGRGGRHYFFHENGTKYKNAVGVVNGVDIRAEGGYVVVPPSIHKSGQPYQWLSSHDIAEIPQEIRNLIEKRELPYKPVEKGGRNNELTSVVGKLVRTGLAYDDVLSMALAWNHRHCYPPLTRQEVEIVCHSIVKIDAKKKEDNKFEFVSFGAIVAEYANKETKWTIDEWLPSATTGLVVAPPGSYKTWFLLDLAISVATGRPFLDMFPVSDVGTVLMVQQEDPIPMLLTRMANIMGLGQEESSADQYSICPATDFPSIFWHKDKMLKFNNKEVMEGFRRAVAHHKPKLVLIDPLYSAAGTDDYMASSAQDMLQLKRMRDEFGCSFMIAHHTTKKPSATGRERDAAWGSQFINAWLETGWQLRAVPEQSSVVVHRHFKVGEPKASVGIHFDITNTGYAASQMGVEEILNGAGSLDIRVVAAISKQQYTSAKQLAKDLGVPASEITLAFNKLRIIKNDGGFFVVDTAPEKGGPDGYGQQ